jgi:hypothetical protein
LSGAYAMENKRYVIPRMDRLGGTRK